MYVCADGIHLNIRLEEDRLCVLVLLGVNEDGKKELIAVEDGHRENKESCSSILRDVKRGVEAPVLAIEDGALGFWGALRDVWPTTKEKRSWFHKLGNVLNKLPKRLQSKAKRMLNQIYYAKTKQHARDAIRDFRLFLHFEKVTAQAATLVPPKLLRQLTVMVQ